MRAVQDNNQVADGPLTSPYVIRLFSTGFSEDFSFAAYYTVHSSVCIRVIGTGTDSAGCMRQCMHLLFTDVGEPIV